jgi:chromosome segregation ATPase
MAHLRASVGREANASRFGRPSAPDCGSTALSLVHQAADVFKGMEDHAREAEARAKSLSKKLQISEERVEAAERAWREIIHQSDCKLQEASKALERAQSRIAATEDQLTAVEFRAEAAEAEARKSKEALAIVEEAIRRRLLCASPEAVGELNAVA